MILVWLLAAFPDPALAQEGSFAFQIRGGGTLPILDFADDARGWEESAGPGTTLSMGFTFPLYRALGGYLGFGQHRFACDEDVCPEGKVLASTGFDVALRLVLGREWIRPWLQGGLHTHRMEARVRDEGGPRSLTSEGGGGYEVGAGLLVQVGERTSLSPGIRFGLGNVPFETRPNLALRFLVFDLGLVVGF
jgi:hypothetical protein